MRTQNANTDRWSYAGPAGGIDASTTAVTFKAAAGAGKYNYITDIQVSHATLGNATELAVRDGAGGTVLWRMTLNTLLEVVTLTSATGDVIFNAQGFAGV